MQRVDAEERGDVAVCGAGEEALEDGEGEVPECVVEDLDCLVVVCVPALEKLRGAFYAAGDVRFAVSRLVGGSIAGGFRCVGWFFGDAGGEDGGRGIGFDRAAWVVISGVGIGLAGHGLDEVADRWLVAGLY